MSIQPRLLVCVLSLVLSLHVHDRVAVVDAKTQMISGAIQEADPRTIKDLLATFDRAEQAMKVRDLDGIMALYAEDYHYHGLAKADIRKIWAQLFEHYQDLESFHSFSVIRTVGTDSHTVAEMTCTGVVWGTVKDTKLRVPVDSWYEEVHYLKQKDGAWRILGNVGGESSPVLQFGIAPHPLF